MGEAVEATVVPSGHHGTTSTNTGAGDATIEGETVRRIKAVDEQAQKAKLLEQVEEPQLSEPEKDRLYEFLAHHNEVFCLEEGERGETNPIEMEINTRKVYPVRQ